MRIWLATVLAALFCAGTAGSFAQDVPPFLSELRGGILAHSVDQGGPGSIANAVDLTRIQDANVELLFTPPDADFWRFVGNPRPMVGATANFGGLESMIYAGLTWHVPVFETGVFVEGALGGALHNGAFTGAVAPARNLGCAGGFYEGVNVGYQFTPNFSAMVSLQHMSHAYLCGPTNRGLTNLGIRLGWTF